MGSTFDRTDEGDIVQTMLEEVGVWSKTSCNGGGGSSRSISSIINTTTAPVPSTRTIHDDIDRNESSNAIRGRSSSINDDDESEQDHTTVNDPSTEAAAMVAANCMITPPSSDTEQQGTPDDDDDDEDVPDEFICPLTMEIFKDPLMDRRGISFERYAIVEWLNRGNDTCPLTREKLSYSSFIPNANLKVRVERWKKDHGYHDNDEHNEKQERGRNGEKGKGSGGNDSEDDDDDEDRRLAFIGTIDAPPNSMLNAWWTRERLLLLQEYHNGAFNSEQAATNFDGGEQHQPRRSRRRRRGDDRRRSRRRDTSDRNSTITTTTTNRQSRMHTHASPPTLPLANLLSPNRSRRSLSNSSQLRSQLSSASHHNRSAAAAGGGSRSSSSSGRSTPTMYNTTPTGVSPATQRRRLAGFLGEALSVVRRSGGGSNSGGLPTAPPLT